MLFQPIRLITIISIASLPLAGCKDDTSAIKSIDSFHRELFSQLKKCDTSVSFIVQNNFNESKIHYAKSYSYSLPKEKFNIETLPLLVDSARVRWAAGKLYAPGGVNIIKTYGMLRTSFDYEINGGHVFIDTIAIESNEAIQVTLLVKSTS